MPGRTIRVGLIGGGGNTTKLHIPGLKKQAGVEIVAVANRTRESGQRVASEFGIAKVHDARYMLDAARRHPSLTAQIVPAPHTLAFDWLSGLLPLAIINIVPQPASPRSKLN